MYRPEFNKSRSTGRLMKQKITQRHFHSYVVIWLFHHFSREFSSQAIFKIFSYFLSFQGFMIYLVVASFLLILFIILTPLNSGVFSVGKFSAFLSSKLTSLPFFLFLPFEISIKYMCIKGQHQALAGIDLFENGLVVPYHCYFANKRVNTMVSVIILDLDCRNKGIQVRTCVTRMIQKIDGK